MAPRFAVFSDLQLGMWFANTDMISRIVEDVVEQRPAAALVAGDFVYSHDPAVPEQIDEAIALLRPLVDAGIPTFAVLGNHDYEVGAADELTAALTENGIPVLQNDATELPDADGGAPMYVVGLGAYRPGVSDPAGALAGVPEDAPRVVFMHNPASFPELPAETAPLAVAGHTHCGQIAIPGLPRWSYLELRAEEEVVTDGWAPPEYGAPGNRLYVNCGIGFSIIPVRILAPPEVVYFELRGP